GSLLALLLPKHAKFRIESVAMGLEVFDQLRGHGGGKRLVGSSGVVTRITEDADFVFNLHHQHRVVAAVHLTQVLHDRSESSSVGFARGIGIAGNGAENVGFVVVQHDARKAFGVLLDPPGRIAGHAVLTGSQPQEDHADVLIAGLYQQAIDERKVILPFRWLDQFPGERRYYSVERDSRKARPKRLHVFQAGGTGIVKLAAEHQEGLAINDELRRGATFF